MDLLVRLATQLDEPLADSSVIPTYLVSRAIREHATVALGGDGGDELFGGYRWYSAQIAAERLRNALPAPVRSVASALARSPLAARLPGRRLLSGLAETAGHALARPGLLLDPTQRARLAPTLRSLAPSEVEAPEARRTVQFGEGATMLQNATRLDFATFMVDDVLAKVDRASMLTSLEIRAPFLDHRVIEFAFGRVPDRLKADARDRKRLLRMLGTRCLPAQLDLRRKQGFSVPLDDWFRGRWSGLIANTLSSASTLLDPSALRRFAGGWQQPPFRAELLYPLVFLRLWEDVYRPTDVV
jgi:asparagine synthase (glutamine-hydrolysing)